jgi:hemoglobin
MNSAAITPSAIVRLVGGVYSRGRKDAVPGPVFEEKLGGLRHAHMPRMVAFWTKILQV